MTHVKLRYSLFALIMLIVGCGPIGFYSFVPHEGINVKVKLKKIKTMHKDKIIFLFFDYKIENSSQSDYFFNPGQIKAKVNNQISEEVWYDSLASVEPKQEKLVKGITSHELYFVFPESEDLSKIRSFEIVDFGFGTGFGDTCLPSGNGVRVRGDCGRSESCSAC